MIRFALIVASTLGFVLTAAMGNLMEPLLRAFQSRQQPTRPPEPERPDAAAFPVARAYEVKKIRKRKMQQPYSHFTPAARMKPALIYEGGLAAARASLPLRRRACRRADICAVL